MFNYQEIFAGMETFLYYVGGGLGLLGLATLLNTNWRYRPWRYSNGITVVRDRGTGKRFWRYGDTGTFLPMDEEMKGSKSEQASVK